MPAWVRPAAGQALPLAADDAAPLGPLVGASGLGMLVGALLFSAFGPGLPRRATFAWGFLLGGSPLFLVPAQRPGLAWCLVVSLVGLGAAYLVVTLLPFLGSLWAGMDRRDHRVTSATSVDP